MSRHLEMPPEVPLLPFTLKCLPFALKSSRTSTYEITCIYVYTQLKHASFLAELYTFVNFILYVCASVLWVCMRASSLYVWASVYRCICMDQVYMYMRVCIGVSAYSEFICMCVCCCGCICMDRVYMYKRVSIGVCMRQAYMYTQVIHKCICIHY